MDRDDRWREMQHNHCILTLSGKKIITLTNNRLAG